MSRLGIIYASTSGHTEYVIDELVEYLKKMKISVSVQRAERAAPEDLTKDDVVLLACGTWNTGGSEGQLNPHMDAFLRERAKDVKFEGKFLAFIALGDERYHYTARASEHLLRFGRDHGGKMLTPPLIIVNEPYGQEEKIRAWGEKLVSALQNPAS